MLISTPLELQQYLPSHHMDSITSMMGYLDNSEHDFLMERIGEPLHAYLSEVYESMRQAGTVAKLTAESGSKLSDSELLITLCQRVIVFDAFARSADIRAVSVNANGFNTSSSDDYDSASPDSIKAFKAQCVKESHAAVNRLLVKLEDWAKLMDAVDAIPENDVEKLDLVELWKKSKYYYRTEGVLLNTATALSEFLDIYESRERFVQLLPDLRYIQDILLSAEIGDALLEDLTNKNVDGKGNDTEKKAIRLLKRAMALHLEDRNRMFKREAAHSEAIQATKAAVAYIAHHLSDFAAAAVETSPLAPKEEMPKEGGWKNNRKGNACFVTKPIG